MWEPLFNFPGSPVEGPLQKPKEAKVLGHTKTNIGEETKKADDSDEPHGSKGSEKPIDFRKQVADLKKIWDLDLAKSEGSADSPRPQDSKSGE